MSETQQIKPQQGFQEKFLSSSADIVIGGGAAGAGKTFALLLDPVRYLRVPGFGGIIFRRTTKQIKIEGGLWDTSEKLFPIAGGMAVESRREWNFPAKTKITFEHLEYEKDAKNYQGAEIPYIGFDELTHFTKKQFTYLMSRNRSTCGIKPVIRATTNPDADSWVRDLIDWWVDDKGFIIPERDGVLRYFTNDNNNFVFGATKKEVIDKCPHIFGKMEGKVDNIEDLIKSITFIEGDVYENKKLLDKDPGYLANLMAQPEEDKMRLLERNWNIKIDGLSVAKPEKISDIFTNEIAVGQERYITVDHARFGNDLCVIVSWRGWKAIKIHILTKSDSHDILKVIRSEMFHIRTGASNVIIDQDGTGVIDLLKGCKVFNGGGSVIKIPNRPESYQNLKTQLSYRLCEDIINQNLMSIDLDNIYVDGDKATSVRVKGKEYDIKTLIEKQLRSIRRKDPDGLKKRIIPKEEQKNILGGMSPDFADAIVMRKYFDLRRPVRGPSR